jgi:hypothetical protein
MVNKVVPDDQLINAAMETAGIFAAISVKIPPGISLVLKLLMVPRLE